MRWCQVLGILISLAIALGCDRTSNDSGGQQITASATAATDASGNVVTRESTAEELSRITDVRERAMAVDQRFPPGAPPTGTPHTKGSRMLPEGELVLADGRAVVLDGVSCTSQGYEYLSRFFLEPTASLIVAETGPADGGKVPAEVWVVEPLGSGTSTSFPVEAGITTGWCDAKRSPTSPHNDRFAALEAAFASEREAYKRAAP
jgi:hypothetical protein